MLSPSTLGQYDSDADLAALGFTSLQPASHTSLPPPPPPAITDDSSLSPLSAPMMSTASSSQDDAYVPAAKKRRTAPNGRHQPGESGGGERSKKRSGRHVGKGALTPKRGRPSKRTLAERAARAAAKPGSGEVAFKLELPTELKSVLAMDWQAVTTKRQVRQGSARLGAFGVRRFAQVVPLPRKTSARQTLQNYLTETSDGTWKTSHGWAATAGSFAWLIRDPGRKRTSMPLSASSTPFSITR
jgi:hypothetical protein